MTAPRKGSGSESGCAPACGLGSILEHDKLLSARATDFGFGCAQGLPHGTHKSKDTVDRRDRMSTTASAAGYNEERRLAKLARLRGTGRRRRQPQHHAMTSPPPPDGVQPAATEDDASGAGTTSW